MSTAPQKLVVHPTAKRDNFAADDRDYLINFRRSLLQMLSVIEKKLGIARRCKHCGQPAD